VIYICYGITKTASTFLYQLTEAVFHAGRGRPWRIRRPWQSIFAQDNYFDFMEPALLDALAAKAGDRDIVIKTHAPPHPDVGLRVAAGEIMASATIRDPREIALSMLDHAARNRKIGRPNFTEFKTTLDTLTSLDGQIAYFRAWAALEGVLPLQYNEICFATRQVIERIARQIGVSVDADSLLKRFANTRRIGQFNRGIPMRYREMPQSDQAVFLQRYAELYREFPFDAEVAEGSRSPMDIRKPCTSRK
jgi:hypothetical protein